MKRREFLKTSLGAVAAAGLAPSFLHAAPEIRLPLDSVSMDKEAYARNNAQTLAIFLVGGMSDFVGNATHLQQIRQEDLSLKPYPSSGFTPTVSSVNPKNGGFWKEGGGEYLQQMIDRADFQATYFRTCMQKDLRKSHGLNQRRFMHGHPTIPSGFSTTLMHVLNRYNLVDEGTLMPYVRIAGGKEFTDDQGAPFKLPSYLRPVTISIPYNNNEVMSNPYLRDNIWEDNQNLNIDAVLEKLSYETNDFNDPISSSLEMRKTISDFVEDVKTKPLPSGVEYPTHRTGKIIETAMRILVNNPDTKIVTTEPGNRWDDHSNALTGHKVHASQLFEAISAAMKHMKAAGKDNINIVVFGDFGRNMNINDAKGWDHGNNQVVYWFGGERYLNKMGVVGETELHVWSKKARLYTRPTESSYTFEPYSVAATVYRMYGITNPEVLTGGHGAIAPGGTSFVKV